VCVCSRKSSLGKSCIHAAMNRKRTQEEEQQQFCATTTYRARAKLHVVQCARIELSENWRRLSAVREMITTRTLAVLYLVACIEISAHACSIAHDPRQHAVRTQKVSAAISAFCDHVSIVQRIGGVSQTWKSSGRGSSNASVKPIRSFASTTAGCSIAYFAALSACAAVGNAITLPLAAGFPAVLVYIHTNSGVKIQSLVPVLACPSTTVVSNKFAVGFRRGAILQVDRDPAAFKYSGAH